MNTEAIAPEIATPTAVEIAASLLAKVSQARNKLLEPMDYPGQWTQRQRQGYDTLRARANAYIQDLTQVQAVLEASTPRLADWLPVRKRLQKAEAALLEQLAVASKWRELPAGYAQDAAFNQCAALKAAITTLRRGGVTEDAGRFYGIPALLLPLITDRCSACGHTTVQWRGSLSAIGEEVAELQKQIANATVRLTSYLRPDVENWLALVTPAESVSS